VVASLLMVVASLLMVAATALGPPCFDEMICLHGPGERSVAGVSSALRHAQPSLLSLSMIGTDRTESVLGGPGLTRFQFR
jgi:hypothetical protein